VALRRQVVDLVGLHLLHDADEAAAVGHVAVVQDELAVGQVRVLVQVVDAVCVEQRRAALHAVHLIALFEQETRQVRAVLAGDAGDQRYFLGSHASPLWFRPARREAKGARWKIGSGLHRRMPGRPCNCHCCGRGSARVQSGI
jgi:hypothetical protein